MDNICQSCGMPIKESADCGTNKDDTACQDYCRYCFKDGEFTSDMSMEDFIEKQVKIATTQMNVPEEKAREFAESIIPNLKRWKQ